MDDQAIPVLVSLQSSAAPEGEEPETISLMTAGELHKTTEGYRLRYEETLDESVPPTQVELILENGVATMHRMGDYDVNMVFRKGQRYEGQYHTPYGDMDLALYCTKVQYTVTPKEGDLRLQYQLDINGQFVAMHKLELSFSPKECKA